MREYSFSEVVAVVGLTAPVVNAWTKKGILVADIEEAGGRGTRRRFSFQNLVEARVVGTLHESGLPPPALKYAALAIRRVELDLPIADESATDGQRRARSIWNRVTDPAIRQPNDGVVLIFCPTLPSGYVLMLYDEPSIRVDQSMVRPWSLTVDLRDAIEHVERVTGDTWIGAGAPGERHRTDGSGNWGG